MRYEIGTLIEYRSDFGLGPVIRATVLGNGFKNGRALVDLDNGRWAYMSQIVRTVPGPGSALDVGPL